MMRQWQQLGLTMMDKQYTAVEIYHDMGIVLLGDRQRGFIQTQLDDLFTRSKEGRTHVLDMPILTDQLESQYCTLPHQVVMYQPII